MTKVIEATENGPGLFNALSIALGIEILSGRLDNQKNSLGYQRLLDEFDRHHPDFKSERSWHNLKQWLAFYNAPKDMEVLLAPVLFKLNQHYQELLETQIQEELFNLIWFNREHVEQLSPWWKLITHDDAGNILFPRLDKLEPEIKSCLLQQVKIIIQLIINECEKRSTREPEDVRELLKQNSVELAQYLKSNILSDTTAYLGIYRCSELKSMANALNISLIESGSEDSPGNKTKIRLFRKKYQWNVVCEEDDFNRFIHQSPQRLKTISIEAFQGKSIVSGPTPQEIEQLNESRILVKEKLIDNPGLGNCAFYAFAIALIAIIQKEKSYESKAMYEYWVSLDNTLANEYDAVCAFDFSQRNNQLLDKLQNSLRRIAYNYQLDELRLACAKATVVDNLETKDQDKESLAYKNAMKYKYKDITANTNYLNFAALYFGKSDDIDPRFNPFANSAVIIKAINGLDKKKIEDTFEELTLVPLFLKLIFGEAQAAKPITEKIEPEVGSSIIEGMNNIIKRFFWGLHQDLSDLATRFKVNLHTLENGINLRNESRGDIVNQHTVTVNNVGNFHWTTQITTVKKTAGFNFSKAEAVPSSETRKITNTDLLSESLNAEEAKVIEPKKEELVAAVTKTHSDLTSPAVLKKSGIEESGEDLELASKPENGRKKARFTLTHSQVELEAQRKRNLRIFEQANEKVSDKSMNHGQTEHLLRLHSAVSNATIAYTEYSESIWFSLFHRHGNTGRMRAKAFNTKFSEIDNYTEAKEQLIQYLNNNKDNGNTHPHSYRTILLHGMLKDKPKPTLQYTSDHYEDLLAGLSSVLNVTLSAQTNNNQDANWAIGVVVRPEHKNTQYKNKINHNISNKNNSNCN